MYHNRDQVERISIFKARFANALRRLCCILSPTNVNNYGIRYLMDHVCPRFPPLPTANVNDYNTLLKPEALCMRPSPWGHSHPQNMRHFFHPLYFPAITATLATGANSVGNAVRRCFARCGARSSRTGEFVFLTPHRSMDAYADEGPSCAESVLPLCMRAIRDGTSGFLVLGGRESEHLD